MSAVLDCVYCLHCLGAACCSTCTSSLYMARLHIQLLKVSPILLTIFLLAERNDHSDSFDMISSLNEEARELRAWHHYGRCGIQTR